MSTTARDPDPSVQPASARRRPVALVVAGAVLVAAIGAGAASPWEPERRPERPARRRGRQPPPPSPPPPRATKAAAATPASLGTASGQRQQGSGSGEQSPDPSGSPKREGVTTLTDGRYDGYVRKVDPTAT